MQPGCNRIPVFFNQKSRVMQLIESFKIVFSNPFFGIGCLLISIATVSAMAIVCNRANKKSFDRTFKILESPEYKELLRAITLRLHKVANTQDCSRRKAGMAKSVLDSHNYDLQVKECEIRKSEIEILSLTIYSIFQ